MRCQRLVGSLLFALAALPAGAERAHVHGKARLDVAVEGKGLTLEFESPLEDLLGFERKPANEKQRAALSTLDAYLKSGQGFVPTPAAGCKLAEASVRTTPGGGEHADARATLRYECAEPRALRELEATVFKRYLRLKRIDARLASAKGQSASRLSPARRVLHLQ